MQAALAKAEKELNTNKRKIFPTTTRRSRDSDSDSSDGSPAPKRRRINKVLDLSSSSSSSSTSSSSSSEPRGRTLRLLGRRSDLTRTFPSLSEQDAGDLVSEFEGLFGAKFFASVPKDVLREVRDASGASEVRRILRDHAQQNYCRRDTTPGRGRGRSPGRSRARRGRFPSRRRRNASSSSSSSSSSDSVRSDEPETFLVVKAWPRKRSRTWWTGFVEAIGRVYKFKGNSDLVGRRDAVVEELRGHWKLRSGANLREWRRVAGKRMGKLEQLLAVYDTRNPLAENVMARIQRNTAVPEDLQVSRRRLQAELAAEGRKPRSDPRDSRDARTGRKEVCKRYLKGTCEKTAEKCMYLHERAGKGSGAD